MDQQYVIKETASLKFIEKLVWKNRTASGRTIHEKSFNIPPHFHTRGHWYDMLPPSTHTSRSLLWSEERYKDVLTIFQTGKKQYIVIMLRFLTKFCCTEELRINCDY